MVHGGRWKILIRLATLYAILATVIAVVGLITVLPHASVKSHKPPVGTLSRTVFLTESGVQLAKCTVQATY